MSAFESSPGAARNFVSLADLRARMGGTRESQDRAIREARLADRLSLGVSDGNSGTPRELDAAIREGGTTYRFAQRK